jgi:hypothetical protein
MSFDGRKDGKKRSLNERIAELVAKRHELMNWLLESPRTLENRIVREEVWGEVRDIDRELNALIAIA